MTRRVWGEALRDVLDVVDFELLNRTPFLFPQLSTL
jgi:hypothetical protein